jgi:hypothetical protein
VIGQLIIGKYCASYNVRSHVVEPPLNNATYLFFIGHSHRSRTCGRTLADHSLIALVWPRLGSHRNARVNPLSQHRGPARKRRGSELRSRDSQIASQASVDNTGGRTDQSTTPESKLQSLAKTRLALGAGEIAHVDCVNATRPIYQQLSHSKHQAVERRRFLAGCGRK